MVEHADASKKVVDAKRGLTKTPIAEKKAPEAHSSVLQGRAQFEKRLLAI